MLIYDNKGMTFDRYTIVSSYCEIFGMSSDPLSPQGFNQFCGTIEKAQLNLEAIGKPVEFKALPLDVQIAIKRRKIK